MSQYNVILLLVWMATVLFYYMILRYAVKYDVVDYTETEPSSVLFLLLLGVVPVVNIFLMCALAFSATSEYIKAVGVGTFLRKVFRIK